MSTDFQNPRASARGAVKKDSLIHLRVPAETKARWVRESRAAGMRLTDWITARVGHKGNEMARTEYTIRPTVLTVDTRGGTLEDSGIRYVPESLTGH